MYDLALAKRLGFVVSIRQLGPQRQPASQEVVSKLGAANRTEAVSRARRLDLIP